MENASRIAAVGLSLLLAVLGIFLLIGGVANMSAASLIGEAAAVSPVQISITDDGFMPDVITISVGTEVIWTNNLTFEVSIVGGDVANIFLPLIIKNNPNTSAESIIDTVASPENEAAGSWGSDKIKPGESYSFSFNKSGRHPYFLAGDLSTKGLVRILDEPIATPTSTQTPTETLSPTPTETPSPTPTSTEAPSPPDLKLSKTDGGIITSPGDSVTYTLTFTNTGDQDAGGTVISDTISDNTTFNIAASPLGWQQVGNTRFYNYPVGDVAVGASGWISIVVDIDDQLPAGIDVITNTAQIMDDGSNGDDPDLSNNSDNVRTPVDAVVDLVVTKTDYGQVAVPGKPLTYTIVYTNTGNQGSTGVTLTETIPSSTTFNSVISSPGWAALEPSSTYTYHVNSLSSGEIGTVQFGVLVDTLLPADTETITNTVVIGDDGQNGSDLTPENNVAVEATFVDARLDLAVEKTDGGLLAVPGNTHVYTLTYANLGGRGVSGVVLTETLPANTSFDPLRSASSWHNIDSSGVYTSSIGSLAPGVTNTISFAVSVDDPLPLNVMTITNTVLIADDGANGEDSDPSNNEKMLVTSIDLEPTDVCGEIGTNTTWTHTGSPYVITCDVTVQSGVTLSIAAGAIVKFQPGNSLLVYGELIALGTALDPIYITSYLDDSAGGDTNGDGNSSTPAPGDWLFIRVQDGASATFDHSIIHYGGANYGTIWAPYNGTVILRDSEVSHASWSGISMNDQNSPYTATLTVERSTIARNGHYGISMDTDEFSQGVNSLSVIDSTIRDNNSGSIYADKVIELQVTGNSFIDNGNYAVQIFRSEFELSQLYNNIVTGKYGKAIYIQSSTFTGVSVLNAEIPYILQYVTTAPESQLLLQAGTIVKTASSLTVNGSIVSQGTEMAKVYITSMLDDNVGGDTNRDGDKTLPSPGNWSRIGLGENASAIFDHTIIRYGGERTLTKSYANIYAYNSSSLILRDSVVSHAEVSGISFYGDNCASSTAVIIERSTIAENGGVGLGLRCNDSVTNLTVIDSVFQDNNSAGISTGTATIINVTGNSFVDNSLAIILGSSEDYELQQFANNSARGNELNALYVDSACSLTGTATHNPEMPYYFRSVIVPAGEQLVLQAGAVVKMAEESLYVKGSLVSQGTESEPVHITSRRDDSVGGDTFGDGDATTPAPGDWRGIIVNYDGSAVFDHTNIRYGGHQGIVSTFTRGNIGVARNGIVILRDSEVSYSAGSGLSMGNIDGYTATLVIERSTIAENGLSGIYMTTGYNPEGFNNLSVSDSTIRDNGSYGIWSDNGSIATIRNSAIYGHSQYGIYNQSDDQAFAIDARNNWWGAESGPAPFGSGDAINWREVCDSYGDCALFYDTVVVNPWSGLPSGYGPDIPWVYYDCDPVNTASGNYTYERTDISFGTRSFPLAVTRFYNSVAPDDSSLGYGWSHSYDVRVAEEGDQWIIVTHGTGREERFVWNGNSYDPPAGTFSILEKVGDHFQLTLKDQTVYSFDSLGRLSKATDKKGNVTTLNYSGTLLVSVTAPDGRTLTFNFTSPVGSDLLTGIIDPIGRTITYTYNISRQLEMVADVRGFTTTFTYDDNHRMFGITDANGHTFVQNTYDDNGRVYEQRDADNNVTTFEYDIPNHLTTVTNPLGNATQYQYDADNRLLSVTDALGNVSSYVYDEDNNRIEVVDKQGNSTYTDYDDVGNPVAITDTLGFASSYSYDNINNLTQMVDALGNATQYDYDPNGNLILVTDTLGGTTIYGYDGYGQLTTETNALGNTTIHTYDAFGHYISLTNALDYTSVYTYDLVGRLLSEQDAAGRVTTYLHSELNKPLIVTNALGDVNTYTYDAVGNHLSETDGRGAVTTFVYDVKDRLTNMIYPLGSVITTTYDAVNNQTAVINQLGNATSYGYDAINQRNSITDPLGNSTTYGFDADGNRTSMTDANGLITTYEFDARNQLISVTNALSGTVTYTYDSNGNRTSMTDANGHGTTYTYDTLNRLATITNPLDIVTEDTYDALGNRISHTKGDGTVITYTYDALNRLVSTNYPGGSIAYEFDAVGNRTVMTDTVGSTIYIYDDLNRITNVDTPIGSLGYNYDEVGNRTNLTYPDGNVVTYTSDSNGRLETIIDWNGQVTTYIYDNTDRKSGILYPNGVAATFNYDSADHITSIEYDSSISGTIGVYTYTLDSVGNRLSMEDIEGLTIYTYDDLYRISSANYPDGKIVEYEYDAMGNRTVLTSTVDGVIIYAYDIADQLLSINDSSGITSLVWDDNGNILSNGATNFTFDPLNRLTEVDNGIDLVEFLYDGDGVRQGKTTNGVVTFYSQDIAAPVPVVLEESTLNQSNRYLYGIDLLMQEDPSGDPIFYHADAIGSTRSLSNLAGQHTNSYSYDVFGEVRSHVGALSQEYTYIGEQTDIETDLSYLRARYYDPATGRFLSPDPQPAYSRYINSLNQYVYSWNNPTNMFDRTGEDPLQLTTDTDNTLVPEQSRALDKWTQFWLWNDDFSRNHDAGIKNVAAGVSAIPVAGELWATNILGFFGKMEQKEFTIRQTANGTTAVLSLATGGTADPYFQLAGGLAQERLVYDYGLSYYDEYMTNQALNVAGFGVNILSARFAKSLFPTEYLRLPSLTFGKSFMVEWAYSFLFNRTFDNRFRIDGWSGPPGCNK